MILNSKRIIKMNTNLKNGLNEILITKIFKVGISKNSNFCNYEIPKFEYQNIRFINS